MGGRIVWVAVWVAAAVGAVLGGRGVGWRWRRAGRKGREGEINDADADIVVFVRVEVRELSCGLWDLVRRGFRNGEGGGCRVVVGEGRSIAGAGNDRRGGSGNRTRRRCDIGATGGWGEDPALFVDLGQGRGRGGDARGSVVGQGFEERGEGRRVGPETFGGRSRRQPHGRDEGRCLGRLSNPSRRADLASDRSCHGSHAERERDLRDGVGHRPSGRRRVSRRKRVQARPMAAAGRGYRMGGGRGHRLVGLVLRVGWEGGGDGEGTGLDELEDGDGKGVGGRWGEGDDTGIGCDLGERDHVGRTEEGLSRVRHKPGRRCRSRGR